MKEWNAECDAPRADAYAASCLPDLSRSACVRLIEEGKLLVNGKPCNKKQAIRTGDTLTIEDETPHEIEAAAQDIPITILYQDADLAVVNKPQGMVVHPAHGSEDGTLVNALLFHLKDLSGINGALRPGIVHRLDKNTSGLIVIAKNDRSHASLAAQFKERTCEKIYYALAEGVFKETEFTVENFLARSKSDRKKIAVFSSPEEGKFASTSFKVLEQYKHAALVECFLHTGRTHQIRVHLASIGHPCLCDREYGFKKTRTDLPGQALHAYSLSFTHPSTGERLTFTAPLPPEMERLRKKLQND